MRSRLSVRCDHRLRDPFQYGIPVHVDACLGGFLVPFMAEAGYHIPQFDFRQPILFRKQREEFVHEMRCGDKIFLI